MAIVATFKGAAKELLVEMLNGCEVREPGIWPNAFVKVGPLLVPSALTTSTARAPTTARWLTVIWASNSVSLSWTTLCTATSVAWARAVEALVEDRGGEITTVAPGRKFLPFKIRRTFCDPCETRLGPMLFSIGGGNPEPKMSVT